MSSNKKKMGGLEFRSVVPRRDYREHMERRTAAVKRRVAISCTVRGKKGKPQTIFRIGVDLAKEAGLKPGKDRVDIQISEDNTMCRIIRVSKYGRLLSYPDKGKPSCVIYVDKIAEVSWISKQVPINESDTITGSGYILFALPERPDITERPDIEEEGYDSDDFNI